MLAYIKGRVLAQKDSWLIIENNNLGYQIFVSQKISEKTKVEQMAELYLYQHQTQDQSSLYGFNDFAELELFKMLISVSGIGPKSALAILNKATVAEIASAIISEDPDQLKSTAGIGAKSAERIVVELKNKMSKLSIDYSDVSSTAVDSEIIEALLSLGYSKNSISGILKNLPQAANISERLRAALQSLNK